MRKLLPSGSSALSCVLIRAVRIQAYLHRCFLLITIISMVINS
jgi:hypothetical protein